jgi:hypothetical protein
MPNGLAELIKRKSRLEGGATYWDNQRLHSHFTPVSNKALMLGSPQTDTGNSQIITVGDAPEGFGSGFSWDRKEDQALLVIFINAADFLGVSIEGLEPWDSIEITSAAGIASFSEDNGNSTKRSLIGLVATGATVAATVTGHPEAIPLVEAAESFAKDQFKQDNVRSKRRDPFGQDPGTGHKARQEGGVLVCLPSAKGLYYSGDGDHKDRWIKDHEDRTASNLPKHIPVGTAFFLNRNVTNKMQTEQAGEAYIIAWDHKFEDNAGYYKLFVRLSKGAPPIIF